MKWGHFTFQNFLSEKAVNLDWLHDYVIIFLIFIMTLVFILLFLMMNNKFYNIFIIEFPVLEGVWTIFPSIILLFLGFPSILILYQIEKSTVCDLSVKVTGSQWFWKYDMSDFVAVEFDSYILNLEDMKMGDMRLLMTDNHLIIPFGKMCRFLISSSDVLHSWAVPSMGVKTDANPGRMNIIFSCFPICGFYFGQCSEICGANHSFMPICLEVTSFSLFKVWVKSFM